MKKEKQKITGKTKALLIDPRSFKLLWLNESATRAIPEKLSSNITELSLNQVLPISETIGLKQALKEVAENGVPKHLQANLIPAARGNLLLVVSVYRLHDGNLLVLAEETWQLKSKKS